MVQDASRPGGSLEGKVALITGAGRGIGRAVALRMARDGAAVVVNDLDADRAERTVEEIVSGGGRALSSVGDVSVKPEVEEMVRRAEEGLGPIQILVNNAGIEHRASLIEHDEPAWDRVVAVNLKGPFLCCQAVVPHMMEAKWGRVINISSMAYRGMGGQSAYDASKAGLLGLTKSLALDLARWAVTVNAVCPGWVETDMVNTGELAALRDKLIKRMPLRRLATPGEVAGAVWFLATPEASYISGQNLNVDGAWLR